MRSYLLFAFILICAGCTNPHSGQSIHTATELTAEASNDASDAEVEQTATESAPSVNPSLNAKSETQDDAVQNLDLQTQESRESQSNTSVTDSASSSQNTAPAPSLTQTQSPNEQGNSIQAGQVSTTEGEETEDILEPAKPDIEKVRQLNTASEWFVPSSSRKWYKQAQKKANTDYLAEYFKLIGYTLPKHSYALIAPIQIKDKKITMQYYSYHQTAFEYSMTADGEENYWPASTVKLAACVMALLKIHEYHISSQAVIDYTNLEGKYNDTVEKLCREAIIPSNNASYNRLMEIAGFDEINDHYLPEVFHFPKMILQRRYVRHHPEDSLRYTPEIQFTEGEVSGSIPERRSSGKMREQCPREANCTTLAELAEVMFRTVLHEELPENRRLKLPNVEIERVRDALKKAPSCIGNGVAAIMGKKAIIYNKGGKVIGDDRLEVAVVTTPDKKERYLIALSMPYYEGVERETNRLAMYMIEAMREKQGAD